MSGTEPRAAGAEFSAIGQALAILGDRWVLLILQRAFLLRIRTFAGWRDALGISESVLAARLKELVDHRIFEPAPYRNGRTRYEYRLTERGLSLWALLVAIHLWERDWADRGRLPSLRHDLCGGDAEPYLGCGACRKPMGARDTRTETGPLTAFPRIGLPRQHRRTVRPGAAADLVAYCPETMEILGDRWSTSVLVAALLGTRRFVDFQSGLGIAPSVLTDRLRRSVELGVSDPLPDGSYRLTDKGLAFFAVFAFLVDWAQRELPAPEGSALTIVHSPCGAALDPVLFCAACGRPLRRREIRFVLG
ncbi:DNA-binding HxlR family transcriptional regulator [Streptosporangium album]|uniref:DNA-binding HxlR family transcriptional regulator n=1 Tax=Streptosporangium album TaxID=47479 RepID=A0A7W7RYU0_9ACTN|nr:helix-turn-helix domain-containing protein [Streptosporangium album]MBB4940088.1 DNA-binding HxlR family transcriptional regulator [Streptosporangium album]